MNAISRLFAGLLLTQMLVSEELLDRKDTQYDRDLKSNNICLKCEKKRLVYIPIVNPCYMNERTNLSHNPSKQPKCFINRVSQFDCENSNKEFLPKERNFIGNIYHNVYSWISSVFTSMQKRNDDNCINCGKVETISNKDTYASQTHYYNFMYENIFKVYKSRCQCSNQNFNAKRVRIETLVKRRKQFVKNKEGLCTTCSKKKTIVLLRNVQSKTTYKEFIMLEIFRLRQWTNNVLLCYNESAYIKKLLEGKDEGVKEGYDSLMLDEERSRNAGIKVKKLRDSRKEEQRLDKIGHENESQKQMQNAAQISKQFLAGPESSSSQEYLTSRAEEKERNYLKIKKLFTHASNSNFSYIPFWVLLRLKCLSKDSKCKDVPVGQSSKEKLKETTQPLSYAKFFNSAKIGMHSLRPVGLLFRLSCRPSESQTQKHSKHNRFFVAHTFTNYSVYILPLVKCVAPRHRRRFPSVNHKGEKNAEMIHNVNGQSERDPRFATRATGERFSFQPFLSLFLLRSSWVKWTIVQSRENTVGNRSKKSEQASSIGEEISKEQGSIGEENSKEEGSIGEEIPREEGSIGEEISKEQGSIGEEIPKEQGSIGEEISKEQGSIGEEIPKEQGSIGEEISKEQGSIAEEISGKTSSIPENIPQETILISDKISKEPKSIAEEISKEPTNVSKEALQEPKSILEEISKKTSSISEEIPKEKDFVSEKNSNGPSGISEETSNEPNISSEDISKAPSSIAKEVLPEPSSIPEEIPKETNIVSEENSKEPNSISEEIPKETNIVSEEISKEPSSIPEEIPKETNIVSEEISKEPSSISEEIPKETNIVSEEISKEPSSIPEEIPKETNIVSEENSKEPSSISEEVLPERSSIPEEIPKERNIVLEAFETAIEPSSISEEVLPETSSTPEEISEGVPTLVDSEVPLSETSTHVFISKVEKSIHVIINDNVSTSSTITSTLTDVEKDENLKEKFNMQQETLVASILPTITGDNLQQNISGGSQRESENRLQGRGDGLAEEKDVVNIPIASSVVSDSTVDSTVERAVSIADKAADQASIDAVSFAAETSELKTGATTIKPVSVTESVSLESAAIDRSHKTPLGAVVTPTPIVPEQATFDKVESKRQIPHFQTLSDFRLPFEATKPDEKVFNVKHTITSSLSSLLSQKESHHESSTENPQVTLDAKTAVETYAESVLQKQSIRESASRSKAVVYADKTKGFIDTHFEYSPERKDVSGGGKTDLLNDKQSEVPLDFFKDVIHADRVKKQSHVVLDAHLEGVTRTDESERRKAETITATVSQADSTSQPESDSRPEILQDALNHSQDTVHADIPETKPEESSATELDYYPVQSTLERTNSDGDVIKGESLAVPADVVVLVSLLVLACYKALKTSFASSKGSPKTDKLEAESGQSPPDQPDGSLASKSILNGTKPGVVPTDKRNGETAKPKEARLNLETTIYAAEIFTKPTGELGYVIRPMIRLDG
eukprot:gene1225-1346_t